MKKISKVLTAAVTLLTLSGCTMVNDYHAVKYYDLQSPESYKLRDMEVQIEGFRNNTPNKQRMLFRTTSGEIVLDDYNKYVQTPDAMLLRYLITAFSNNQNSSKEDLYFNIYGRIFVFEFDVNTLEAICGVEYTIAVKEDSTHTEEISTRSAVYRAKAISAEPAVVARAMSRCVSQLADQIHTDLENYKNEFGE